MNEREERPILNEEAALTILTTGFVKVRSSQKIFHKALTDETTDKCLKDRTRIIFGHETVHCVQSITTAYTFKYCEYIRDLSAQFGLWLADQERERSALTTLCTELDELETQFDCESGCDPLDGLGVSPRQLMEASAVLESVRAVEPNLTLQKLLTHLPGNGLDSTYMRVFGIMARVLGPEETIRLTPLLVYIALNTEAPGQNFFIMLRELSSLTHDQRSKMSLEAHLNTFWPSRETSIIDRFAQGEKLSRSPVWNTIGQTFAAAGDRSLMHLVAAYPSSLLAESSWSKRLGPGARKIMPILLAFEDGTFRMPGPHHDKNLIRLLLSANEILGAMYKVGHDKRYATLCLQMECPSRTTDLCHMSYPLSPSDHWQNCGFRARFQNISGMLPEEFMQWLGLKTEEVL